MTSRILAIDTTGPFGSLALIAEGRVVEETLLHSEEGFSCVLHQELGQLLARRAWRLHDIDAFAAAAGPGSFTGIRVGLAAVKGLAEAERKPAFAVSNLQALAWHGSGPLRAVLMDARRGEIFGAVYTAGLELAQPETVAEPRAWLESLPEGEMEFLSADLPPYRQALDGSRFAQAPRKQTPRALAGAVGLIAAARLASGAAPDPSLIDANYVRRSDAELHWKDG
jgi:tRNA threonylcarbamoyladenosine biosynthesis protein TsaB